ncbi:class gamma glutathione S-transferase 2 [Absidia repens]|uniref:Class gamma glutathione S-transferase 2 n=1 Tax=Absidia repens TaxID=90262 RepID=A0A1X2IZW0_9FUNG|nr:class gamma glutathione S-transferase 2 [Absidia repens]
MTFTTATLHYFDIEGFPSTAALGENLNLFLKDAGIDFTYIRHKHDEWPAMKEDLTKNKNVPHATMPFVEVNGKVFNKTAPTLRYLSKQLGKYNGDNDEESYRLDTVADVTRDHFGSYAPLFKSTDEEKIKEHFEKDTKKYLAAYNNIYAQTEGPFILGEKISYADFLVYHNIDDDRNAWKHTDLLEKEYPHVAKFGKAFTQRPNLVNYFASLKN